MLGLARSERNSSLPSWPFPAPVTPLSPWFVTPSTDQISILHCLLRVRLEQVVHPPRAADGGGASCKRFEKIHSLLRR